MRKFLWRIIPAAAMIALWTGCIEPVGDGIDMSQTGTPPASGIFNSQIKPLFVKYYCTGCHMAGGEGWDATGADSGGLDLLSDSAYSLLVNHPAYEPGHDTTPPVLMYRVNPGHPESSYIYLKLSEHNPPYSTQQMPLNLPPMSTADLNTIKAWISQGAPQ